MQKEIHLAGQRACPGNIVEYVRLKYSLYNLLQARLTGRCPNALSKYIASETCGWRSPVGRDPFITGMKA